MIDDTRSKSAELGESGNQLHHHQHENGEEGDREGDAESDGSGEHEGTGFKLSNCLDYVKSGMEAIIEDEVTSRFLAEELKNWNLLTRTNRHYEFISWRLTVIWMIGFLIRYFVLMPMRVLICFIGVSSRDTTRTMDNKTPKELHTKNRTWTRMQNQRIID